MPDDERRPQPRPAVRAEGRATEREPETALASAATGAVLVLVAERALGARHVVVELDGEAGADHRSGPPSP